jgi:hypothetical protein
MDDYRRVLRRVGWVLIVFGLLDMGAMAYCIANQISYSSSFNIFAVAAGIYLVRGHLGAARLVAWFSALYFTVFALMPVIFLPKLGPEVWAVFRAEPIAVLGSFAFLSALLALLAWTYWQLRQPAVLHARAAAGLKTAPPYIAFALAVAFIGSFVVILHDVPLNKAGGPRPPRREQTVVVRKEPLLLEPSGTQLTPAQPLEVLGETSSLCVVLKSGIGSLPQAEMDKAFKDSLGGSQLTVSFARADGQNFVLKATSQAWKRSGELTGDGELAACSSCGCAKPSCGELFPAGASFKSVTVASSAPISVLGVYWESTNAFDSPKEEPVQGATTALNHPIGQVTYSCGSREG